MSLHGARRKYALRLNEHRSKSCEAVNLVLDEYIGHVAHRIQELKAPQKQLVLCEASAHKNAMWPTARS